MKKGKKLVVMIPCYNEEKTLSEVVEKVPRKIPGIDKVEILVIDDGSTDKTAQIAKKLKVNLVSHYKNEGLGVAFKTGVENALAMDADIVTNIDADMQFNPLDIPKIIKPILAGEADMVTASRFKDKKLIPKNMPWLKKIGNKGFTTLINLLTGEKFTDTQCGFRAYSREAALKLNLFGRFTYTQEVFLDLVNKGMKIVDVPVKVKYFKKRKAKISGSLLRYGLGAITIILRTFRDYKPLVFFGIPGIIILTIGFLLSLASLVYWLILHKTSPVRMYLFTGIFLLTFGFLLTILALIADMLKRMRRNQEELLYQSRKNSLQE